MRSLRHHAWRKSARHLRVHPAGRQLVPQQHRLSGGPARRRLRRHDVHRAAHARVSGEYCKRYQPTSENAHQHPPPRRPHPRQLPASAGDHHRPPALPRGDPQHPVPATCWRVVARRVGRPPPRAAVRHVRRPPHRVGGRSTGGVARGAHAGAHHERRDRLDSRAFSTLHRRPPVRRRHAVRADGLGQRFAARAGVAALVQRTDPGARPWPRLRSARHRAGRRRTCASSRTPRSAANPPV